MYDLLHFIYACNASQIHVRTQRIIYMAMKIHLNKWSVISSFDMF